MFGAFFVRNASINFAQIAVANGGTVLQWVQSDLGVTIATGVSQWNDQSGNARHYVQATGANQPTFGAAALAGFPSVRTDGVSDEMIATFTLPAPGTTPTYVFMVMRTLTWVSGGGFVGQDSATSAHVLYMSNVTPDIIAFNATNGQLNAAHAVNTWDRIEFQFGNSTADYLKVANTNASGVNSGNNASTSNRKFGRFNNGATYGNAEYQTIGYLSGTPNAALRSAIAQAAVAKYGLP